MSGDIAATLADTCHALAAKGLGTSTSGNVSARDADTVLLTPTGVALGDIAPGDLARMTLDGTVLGDSRPTKEAAFHLAIYRARPDVAVAVHVHPTHTIALSALLPAGDDASIPPLTPQFVMRAGGAVPLIGYHAPGSQSLRDAVASACHGSAMVLQNHGAVAFGATFARAVGILEELEENCRIRLLAGEHARHLDGNEIDELLHGGNDGRRT